MNFTLDFPLCALELKADNPDTRQFSGYGSTFDNHVASERPAYEPLTSADPALAIDHAGSVPCEAYAMNT